MIEWKDMRGKLKDLKNIITLKVVNKKKIAEDAKRRTDELLRMDLLRNTAKLSNSIQMRGYALCVWDEKGVPCIAWNTKHPENIISDFIIPSFLSTSFQSIVSNKVATSEVYKDE